MCLRLTALRMTVNYFTKLFLGRKRDVTFVLRFLHKAIYHIVKINAANQIEASTEYAQKINFLHYLLY